MNDTLYPQTPNASNKKNDVGIQAKEGVLRLSTVGVEAEGLLAARRGSCAFTSAYPREFNDAFFLFFLALGQRGTEHRR